MNAAKINAIDRGQSKSHAEIVDYYTEAGADYEAWSKGWNMHFGLPRRVSDVFVRERMLANMNDAVIDRVLPSPRLVGRSLHILDLGCGLGATMRHGARREPSVSFSGFTIVDWQVERARQMNSRERSAARLSVRKEDYLDLPLRSSSADGAYALESSCYAPGASKEALIAEAARVLKPGAKLVVADGFRIDDGRAFGRLGARAYRRLCESWAIDELADRGQFIDALERHGFEDVRVEDVSLRIAWSVMWVPFVTLKFLWDAWRHGELVSGWRASNVVGSVLTMVLGLMRSRFRYLVISARKAQSRSLKPSEP